MSLPVCTHAHLLRERLYHRGQWNDDPVKRVVDLCAECRAAFRAADIRLERADGSRWREPCLQVEGAAQTLVLPVVAAPPVLLPSTGGEVVVSLPVEVEHPVEDEKKTCKVEGCDRPMKAKDLCGSHYEKVYRRNGRGKVERPVAPEVEAKAAEIEAERAAFADAYADAKAALLEVRQALAPVLGLQEAEESAAVMASRVSVMVAQLQAEVRVPLPAESAESRTLEQRYQVAEARLTAVRRHLAPLLGIHEDLDGAPEMAAQVARLVLRLETPPTPTGRDLSEELAGAVADLELSDARLRAWELWHQESEGGGNPTLLAGLLRLTRGARP